MSQEAVERFLGRMLTDQRFRTLVGESLESASRQEGFQLNPVELRLLSSLEPGCCAELAGLVDPGLRRAGGVPGKTMSPRLKDVGIGT